MGVLRLTGFTGTWPIRDARALPDNAAIVASNVRAVGGAYLEGISSPALIKALNASTKKVYRIPLPGVPSLANSYWMEFSDINTDVQRAPIVNDSFKRIYWASPSTGLKYAPQDQIIASGTAGLLVGVPAPATTLTAAAVAGTGALDPATGKNTAPITDRSYVVTFISSYGEESQPSPATFVTGAADQDYLLTNIPQPGAPGQRAAFQTIRLYRTVTGLTGVASFFKVVDLAVGTTNYTDRLSDTAVSGSTALQSVGYGLPPENMQGLVAMPNGIFVGWNGSTLYFSEDYRPHAWPPEYQITVDNPIVGLGVFGNTCVVCTEGPPAAVSGTTAAAMTLTKIDTPLPCLSRQSIVSAPEGVYWSTETGICRMGPDGLNGVTQELVNREDWQLEFAPTTHRSAAIGGRLMVARTVAGITTDGFMFVPTNPQVMGIVDFDLPFPVVSMGVEPWTGKPWAIGGGNLYELEVPGSARLPYVWLSKEFRLPYPANFKVYEAYYDDALDAALHLRVWVLLRDETGVAKTLIYDQDVPASGLPVLLPNGFKSDVWQFELSGDAELQSLAVATSIVELRNE